MLRTNDAKMRFTALLTILVLLALLLPVLTASAATFSDIYNDFKNINGRMLVISHKADWRHHPENSLSGILSAINMGADIIEVDVRKTSDGVLVLHHDSTVDRMTNGIGLVSGKTLSQIKALYLKEGEGGYGAALTNERIPTLQEVFDLCKSKVMINVDKAWDIRNEIYTLAANNNMVDHVIFKSSEPNSVVAPWLDSKNPRPNYVAVILDSNVADIDALIAGAEPDAFEVVFETENAAPISAVNMNKMKPAARIWMNSLWDSLCAGHTDEVSLTNSANGWGWLIDRDADMIQTDRSRELINYLNPGSHGSLTGGWTNTDIGSPAARGYASYDSDTGQYKIAGSGNDIWGTSDKFHFAYQQMTGDCSIIVRVNSLLNTHENAKAGVMIRESTAANSKFMDLIIYPEVGIRFQKRAATGGSAVTIATASGTPPKYLKLVREGDSFSAYYSNNGVAWSQIGTAVTQSMNSSIYIGMCVTSHHDGVIADAMFQNACVHSLTDQQSVVLQQGLNGYSGTTDAHILESKPDRNTGGHTLIEATTYNGSSTDEKNILCRFDLSSIPSNVVIISAILDLCLIATRNGNADKTVDIHEITGPWTEGNGTGIDGQTISGVTWTNQPSYNGTTLVSQIIGNTPDTWYSFDLTELVRDWVDGTKANYGILVKEDNPNPSAGAKDFASSEYTTDTTKRPKLIIKIQH